MAQISVEESAARVEELAEGGNATVPAGGETTADGQYQPPDPGPGEPPICGFLFKLTRPSGSIDAPSTGKVVTAEGTFKGQNFTVDKIAVTYTFAEGTPQQVVKQSTASWGEGFDDFVWKAGGFSFKGLGDVQLRIKAVATWRNLLTGTQEDREVTRTVVLQFSDNQKPSVTINAPSVLETNTGLKYKVPFNVTASDNVGIDRVQYRINGGNVQNLGFDSSIGRWVPSPEPEVPYRAQPGAHTITVNAFDITGLTTQATHTFTTKDIEAPILSVNADDTISLPAKDDGTASLPELSGTISDRLSGVGTVQWVLDPPVNLGQATWKTAALTPLPGVLDRRHWTTGTVAIPKGIHRIVVRAFDKAGNPSALRECTIEVLPTYPPVDPTTIEYLRTLVDFVCERFTHTNAAVTPTVLRTQLHQPMAQLVALDPLAVATYQQRRESELRMVTEVLRHRFELERVTYANKLAQAPQAGMSAAKLAEATTKRAGADETYRRRAYEAILERLGASLPELRDAVRSGPAARQVFADRLGITPGSGKPDNLQRLLLEPAQTTEAALEQLFGLRAFPSASAPALPPTAVPATLLGSLQAERLDVTWREQDATRSGAVVDPDVVAEQDVAPGATAAAELLQERQEWLDNTLQWMRTAQVPKNIPVPGPKPGPGAPDPRDNPDLVRFDYIVGIALTGVERLLELADRQDDGEDVTPILADLDLTLAAFARLLEVRAVIGARAVLEADLEDAYAILLQVAKTRAYPQWRDEEHAAGVLLSPVSFVADTATAGPVVSPWRTVKGARQRWLTTLHGRIEQRANLRQALASAVDAAERDALPLLRDGIIAALTPLKPPAQAITADALSRLLFLDVLTNGETRLSRVDFAIQALQAIVLGVRTGTAGPWARKVTVEDQDTFDEELRWMGSYANWYSAMKVFLYPENMLYPVLRPTIGAPKQTGKFQTAIAALREARPLTPDTAKDVAKAYDSTLQLVHTPDQLKQLRKDAAAAIGTNTLVTMPVAARERYFDLPLAIALQLHRSGQYLAALDWFRMVYAYDLPPNVRKTWKGLEMERDTSTKPRKFRRKTVWLQDSLNPHDIVHSSYSDPETMRYDVYTRFVVTAIVRCLLDFADGEFVQDTNESLPRARSLYRIAADLLAQPELNPVPIPGLTPNEVLTALRRRAQVALAKLNTGRNAAGLVRQLEPVTPVSAAAGASPLISGASPFGSETSRSLQPTPYRYATLIERTKQLAALAQQIEQAYLSALEKRDAEAYNLLKARQDLQLANAGLRLQALRAVEAADGIVVAQAQRERADLQVQEYQTLLNNPMNRWEDQLLTDYRDARRAKDWIAGIDAAMASFQAVQAAMNSPTPIHSLFQAAPTAAVIGLSIAKADQIMKLNGIETDIQRHSLRASVENRVREWRMQQSIARKDVVIAQQQVKLAADRQAIVGQEGVIADLQHSHAQATLAFLEGKFTNIELYEWMIDVLADVYGYFLRQATSLAQFAQHQLAFETQQAVPAFVRKDYWQPTQDGVLAGTAEPDRRGLTGSARLLRDIYELDQFAFENNKRKLQLTKTVSLARTAPAEFQQFRRTGVLTFATPMALFDQDFPGHYLRLVKRVRTSVIALVPPNQGIRATLTNAGVSRVVIGGDSFQTVRLVRDAEQVALTAAANATGVFELDAQPELLLPFEFSGVDSLWSLEMPRAANPFDYRTIADVLVTFEYTALASPAYRQKVIAQLDRTAFADRAFSFADAFPDQWYDLHNPQSPGGPASVEFDVAADQFPANLESVDTAQLAMYVLFADGVAGTPVQVSLEFQPGSDRPGGGVATTTSTGVASTRLGNGAPWTALLGQEPYGRWRVSFPERRKIRDLLADGSIVDLAFVISYSGRTPEWPE